MTDADGSADRLVIPGRIRVPRAAVVAAVLGLSMLLSVAPVLGARNDGSGNGNSSTPGGNGTSGDVKVHDAIAGVETSGTDNEPHVCAFWLGFTSDAPFEAGTWVVVSWAPTGDGSTVASGVYDTAGDGVDSSSVIDVAAGHYRVEWAATGATNSKKKTFWVDACDEPGSPAEEEWQGDEPAPPTDAPGSPAEEEWQGDEPAPPTDAPGSPVEDESPAEEEPVTEGLVLSEEETAPSDDESQAEEEAPPLVEEVAPSGDEDAPPTDESAVEDVTAPIDVEDGEKPAQAEDRGSSENGTPPVQEELGATGGSDEPTMSDTAVPTAPAESGPLAAIGLLALLVLSTGLRRDRRSDRDSSVPAT